MDEIVIATVGPYSSPIMKHILNIGQATHDCINEINKDTISTLSLETRGIEIFLVKKIMIANKRPVHAIT